MYILKLFTYHFPASNETNGLDKAYTVCNSGPETAVDTLSTSMQSSHQIHPDTTFDYSVRTQIDLYCGARTTRQTLAMSLAALHKHSIMVLESRALDGGGGIYLLLDFDVRFEPPTIFTVAHFLFLSGLAVLSVLIFGLSPPVVFLPNIHIPGAVIIHDEAACIAE